MLEIIAASSLVAALIVAFSIRRPAPLSGSDTVAGQIDDDLPCPWCLAPTREDDVCCPSCGKRFG